MEIELDIDLLKKENEQHEKLFKEFHECNFRQMAKEAIKMAVEILLNQGSLPSTDADFEEKSNELVKIIIKKN